MSGRAIKIDAPRSWYDSVCDGIPHKLGRKWKNDIAVRVIRESDWRKVMALVNEVAAGIEYGHHMGGKVAERLEALRKHLPRSKT